MAGHDNEKAVWIDRSITYRLGIAAKIAGKTIKGYITDIIKERIEQDLSGLNLPDEDKSQTESFDEGDE